MASNSTSLSSSLGSSGFELPLSSFTSPSKRKNEASEASQGTKTPRKGEMILNEAPETLFDRQDEAELQLLVIESRRLDFEVAKWKQQQKLRRETLQLKSEEINLKEATTRQQLETQGMELRARLIKALDETNKPPAQMREYLELLEG
ncbi:hypothetical protein PRIC2_009718 [Phytophthora ramorum]